MSCLQSLAQCLGLAATPLASIGIRQTVATARVAGNFFSAIKASAIESRVPVRTRAELAYSTCLLAVNAKRVREWNILKPAADLVNPPHRLAVGREQQEGAVVDDDLHVARSCSMRSSSCWMGSPAFGSP